MPRKHSPTFQRIAADAADLDVRLSTAPDAVRWIVYRRSTGNGVAHPACNGLNHAQNQLCALCFHKSEQDAQDAIADYLKHLRYDDSYRVRKRKTALAQPAPRQSRTLAEELAALRAYMTKRDINPWHGWKPCSGAHCMCSTAPNLMFWPKGS